MNAAEGSVTFYIQHNFYNINFKIEHKLYTASGSARPRKNPGCAPEYDDGNDDNDGGGSSIDY
jgi:hypothetical protein